MSQEPQTEAPQQPDRPVFQPPKKKRKWLRRLIVILILVVVLAVVLRACLHRNAGTISSAYVPVQASRQPLTVTVTGTGAVQPRDKATVTALLRGEVLTAPFEEGDVVERGQVLFTLDPSDGENAVRSAESALARAELSLEQAQLSYDNLLSTQRDSAESAQLKATAAGAIARLYAEEGDTLMAGSPVADILDRETMELTLPFHGVDAAGFAVGQAAQVTVTGTAQTLSGVIAEVGTVDTVIAGGARVRSVVIRVPNPGALAPGDTATATVGAVASAQAGSFAYAASRQVLAPTGGKLLSLTVREGDWVTRDQVIGAFEVPDMSSQIDSAALSLRSAQLGVSDAQESLRRAREALEDYTVTAPISGTVIEKNVEAGDTLDASAGYLVVLYDLSRLTFTMNISELDVAQLVPGQPVTFTTTALEGRTFSGTLTKVNINGTTMNGSTSYPVTVEIADGAGLYPGMNVSATVLVADLGEVLTVPVDAIQRGDLVYVPGPGALDEAGNLVDPSKLQERQVTLGRSDSENIEILSGLEEGDTVFVPNAASNLFSMMMSMGGGR